jgi:hypothetical protein
MFAAIVSLDRKRRRKALDTAEAIAMSVDQIKTKFARLTKEEQAGFLCRLGVRLTTLSRTFVSDRKTGGISEICHRIFGQLGHIISNSTQRYPDAVFVDLLNAIADEHHLVKEFSDALIFALDGSKANISPSDTASGVSHGRRPAKVSSE